MNDLNMEKQLKSWTPRRPSPRVKRRLFGTVEAGQFSRNFFWRPALGLAVILLASAGARQNGRRAEWSDEVSGISTTMALTNPAYVCFFPGVRHSIHNQFARNFEWTIDSLSTSSKGSSFNLTNDWMR